MTILKHTAFFVLVLPILSHSAASARDLEARHPANTIVACSISQQYIVLQAKRIPFYKLSVGDWQSGNTYTDEDLAEFPWRVDRPTPELSAAFSRAAPASPLARCPRLGAFLRSTGIRSEQGVPSPNVLRRKRSSRRIARLTFSLPVISPNGQEAMLIWTLEGAESRTGGFDHLRLSRNGHWIVTETIRNSGMG